MKNANCKKQIGNATDSSVASGIVEVTIGKPFDLSERFLDFADRVASGVEALPESRLGRRIADQLLRKWNVTNRKL